MRFSSSSMAPADDKQFELRTGEVMLVPASTPELNLIPEGKSRLLEVYL